MSAVFSKSLGIGIDQASQEAFPAPHPIDGGSAEDWDDTERVAMKMLTREHVAEHLSHIRTSNVRESMEGSEKAILAHDAALRDRVKEAEDANERARTEKGYTESEVQAAIASHVKALKAKVEELERMNAAVVMERASYLLASVQLKAELEAVKGLP